MIVSIIGTRPQYIKASVLSHAFRIAKIKEMVIDTKQHYSKTVSAAILKSLPYKLSISKANKEDVIAHPKTLEDLMFNIDAQLKKEIKNVRAFLVYGDTNSTLAGALIAKKYQKKIIHIEAGERSFNESMPEEKNRIIVDALSDLLLCVNSKSLKNLNTSNCKGKAEIVGDLMLDAVISTLAKQESKKNLRLERIIFDNKPFVYFTIHRLNNTENSEIVQSILDELETLPYKIIWPLHPRVLIFKTALKIPANVIVVDAVNYIDSLQLIKQCAFVVTDSGGLQKEAYWLQKKCITWRAETEWIETLKGNWNMLYYLNSKKSLEKIINTKPDINKWSLKDFGEGKAAEKIVKAIQKNILI